MNAELERLAEQMEKALRPEEVFGTNGGIEAPVLLSKQAVRAAAQRTYRRLSHVAHPDRYRDHNDARLATTLMAWLNSLWSMAEQRIKDGVYGQTAIAVIKLKGGDLVLTKQRQNGDLCAIYDGTYPDASHPVLIKLSLDPRNNDLLAQEVAALKTIKSGLAGDGDGGTLFFPDLVTSFTYRDHGGVQRQANVFGKPKTEWFSLDDVKRAYPDGIDPKDMTWMLRRLLVALWNAHQQGIIHGAVVPSHVIVQPEVHGLMLVDWCYSTAPGQKLKAIVPSYRPYYPYFDEYKASHQLDIYMAATTMFYTSPVLPTPLNAFFRGCFLPYPSRRPDDAGKVLEAFDELIDKLWPRRFHEFKMPTTVG